MLAVSLIVFEVETSGQPVLNFFYLINQVIDFAAEVNHTRQQFQIMESEHLLSLIKCSQNVSPGGNQFKEWLTLLTKYEVKFNHNAIYIVKSTNEIGQLVERIKLSHKAKWEEVALR